MLIGSLLPILVGLPSGWFWSTFNRPLRVPLHQQLSGAGDRPAGRGERLACRVCDGERGREGLVESAATCRASSSIRAVKVPISSPDEDTQATRRKRDFCDFIRQLGHVV